MLTKDQERALERRLGQEDGVRVWFRDTAVAPKVANPVLAEAGAGEISEPTRAGELLKRPGVGAAALAEAAGATFGESEFPGHGDDALTAVETEVKYEGYISREVERANRLREQAEFRLGEDLPYREFITLSYEAREKLDRVRPLSLAQAGRIPGVSPADLQNLMMEVRRWRKGREEGGG
jgi:tRNA uridine 5-carboxymethylaminomethyl modification enzyme